MLRQTRTATLAQRAEVAESIQRDLKVIEQDYHAIMLRSADFRAKLLQVRSDQHLSEMLGHSVLASLAAADLAVTEGMGHVICAHRELRQVAERVGLRVTATGDVDDSGKVTQPAIAPQLHVAA